MKKTVYEVGGKLIAVVIHGGEVVKCWELRACTFDLPVFDSWGYRSVLSLMVKGKKIA